MISQTAEYALRAVSYLAAHLERSVTTQEIAQEMKIPPSYLSKVLGYLVRESLVRSRRGPTGGFVLARDPGRLTLLEVIEAVEPWDRHDKCPIQRSDHARHLCPLHEKLASAWARVEDAMRVTTVAEVAQREMVGSHR